MSRVVLGIGSILASGGFKGGGGGGRPSIGLEFFLKNPPFSV